MINHQHNDAVTFYLLSKQILYVAHLAVKV